MLKKITLISLLLPFTLQAATKLLVCDLTDPSALDYEVEPPTAYRYVVPSSLPIGYWIYFRNEDAKEASVGCEDGYDFDCETAKKSERLAALGVEGLKSCSDSEFLVRYEFILNSDYLDQIHTSNVDFIPRSCGIPHPITRFSEAQMSSTPSLIKFIGADSSVSHFMVDRATLKAGYNADRTFQCRVEEIKLKNQI